MKERPILFSAPMVRSILAGSKTQTRRVVKPRKDVGFGCLLQPHELAGEVNSGNLENCPYGQPGDRLWVRETWQGPLMDADTMETEYRASPDDFHNPEYCVYAADGGSPPEFMTLDDELVCRWRPSIHMPRWASRILLEVVSVRVERLLEISEADAQSEGPPKNFSSWRDNFCALWQQINGYGSWDANPWVWVIEFKRVTQ